MQLPQPARHTDRKARRIAEYGVSVGAGLRNLGSRRMASFGSRGTAGWRRPAREYRKSRADRVGNAIFSVLARVGIGPSHLLTTRGRMTGRLRTTPVILVMQGQQRWLVAPYGAVPWVLNARAAGQVRLRRGRDRHDYTIRQLPAAQAGPILQRYLRIAPATRPYFQASKDSPVADFIAEADRHPVFELTPLSETSAGSGGAVPGWLKKAALGRGVVLAARMWVLGHVAGRRCVGLRPGRVGREAVRV